MISALLCPLLLAAGLTLGPLSIMGLDLEKIPGELADPRLNNYFLEHGWLWLQGKTDSYWDAPFFFPLKRTMTFSENHLGTLPIYALHRSLGIDREGAFQGWMLTIFVLNYVSCLLALRALGVRNWGAAAVGAYLFAFSLPVIGRLGHAQLLPRFFVPWAFYFAWRFTHRPHWKNLAGLQLCILLQLYCGVYLGFFLLLLLPIFLGLSAYRSKEPVSWLDLFIGARPDCYYRVAVSAVCLVLLSPLLIPYLSSMVTGTAPTRSWGEIAELLPTLGSLLRPPGDSLLWSGLENLSVTPSNLYEHACFLGLVPWVCLILVLLRGNKDESLRPARLAVWTILLALILTLNWEGYSLYRLIYALPGLGGIRAVSRMVVVLVFLLALPVAVIYAQLCRRAAASSSWRTAPLLFIVVLMADQMVVSHPAFLKRVGQARSHLIVGEVQRRDSQAEAFVFMPKAPHDPGAIHVDAMLASQILGIPTINGYTAFWPAHFRFNEFYRRSALDQWMAHRAMGLSSDPFRGLVVVGSPQEPADELRPAGRSLPRQAYRASIVPEVLTLDVPAGKSVGLGVRVHNLSSVTWPVLGDSNGDYRVRLSHRWLDSQGHRTVLGFVSRHDFPAAVGPRQEVSLNLQIQPDVPPGEYILEIGLVQEKIAWFADLGSPPARIQARVR